MLPNSKHKRDPADKMLNKPIKSRNTGSNVVIAYLIGCVIFAVLAIGFITFKIVKG